MKPEIINCHGIKVELERNEAGQWDASIAASQSLPVEWIVRGVADKKRAAQMAVDLVKLRLEGYILCHGPEEGAIRYFKASSESIGPVSKLRINRILFLSNGQHKADRQSCNGR
jgi:hypothetical protein